MEADGSIKNVVSKEDFNFPQPGWSEQNPIDWWEGVLQGIKELTKDCDKSKVAGISLVDRCMTVILDDMIKSFDQLYFGTMEERVKRPLSK